ncbi:MAG: riboflavin biosynthesis protein RibF, partial [Candidatus Cloacimonetes bacterium]|nr:riboflavin biosynthesis protein RibF [Candidatus Cloacimonadota bacterium]
EMGISDISYLNFTREMSQMSAISFLSDILVKKYHPLVIVVGYDTHFGVNKQGNMALLVEYEDRFGYTVHKIPPYIVEGNTISSTLIRSLIAEGKVAEAYKYLGYHYSITGRVMHGQQIGRIISVPTTNLQPLEPNKLIPNNGVYFTRTKVKGQVFYGATNIGVAPTLRDEEIVQIETHLLDFSRDIYDEEIEVSFIEKIRNERKFGSMIELKKQIDADIQIVRKMING